MSFESEALFFQTDLTNWNTSFPVECVNKCVEPPLENNQYSIFRNLFYSDNLIKQFSFKKSNKYPWKMEISPDGTFIIILKNNNLELRSSKLDFSHINFQCQIYRDMYPQWRCVAWSNLSNYFGVTFSNGICNIWDIQGSRLVFKYAKSNEFDPVTKLVIINMTKGRIKVYILTLKGKIMIYFIQNLKVLNFHESNINFLATPILCSEVSSTGNLLVLGTYSQHNKNEAFKNGIISCRLIDEEPFIVCNVENEVYSRKQLWIHNIFFKKYSDAVYAIQISKDNQKLVALHLSGNLSILLFPSLIFVRRWNPSFNLANNILTPDFIKTRVMPSNFSDSSIIQICWWNSEYIVVALQNGRIIILNPDQIENGNISLYPFPQIQESIEKSFFVLNCISKSKESEIAPPEDRAVVESSMWKYMINFISYFFQDNSSGLLKKNVEMCSLNFQLSCFKSTTPEELFEIQIIKKQYTQALDLAQKYDLDFDIVYQKQWRDSNKSIDDIKNILVRIKKRNWILNECLKRIPKDIESLKCLLKLGLKLTGISQLEHCSIHDDSLDEIDFEIDGYFINTSSERHEVECEINVKDFNLIQLELVRIRIKLLSYWDKLSMYEEIISSSKGSFQRELFKEFKNLSPFELGILFANSGNIVALRVLFDFYHFNLKEHILTIMSEIPECIEPKLYQNLFDYLPIFSMNSDNKSLNNLDWCEADRFSSIYNQIITRDAQEMYYQNNPQHLQLLLKPAENCRLIFTKWINMRIRNIELVSLNADYALELLKIAKKLGIEIDQNLEFNLRFLCEAIYNCQISNTFISLTEFESMSDLEKAKILMSKTDPDRFLVHFVHWIVPLSQEIHSQSSKQSLEFFRLYLQDLGRNFLICIRKILEDKNCTDTILNLIDFRDFINIHLTILYQDDDASNFNECSTISQLLSALISEKHETNPDQYLSEEKQLQDINNYISVLRMMEKYEVHKTIKFIHNNKMNGDLVENFITSMVFQYLKTVKTINKSVIKSIFSEMQIALSLVFKSIHPKLIYKNLLKSLLESGDKKKINLASQFMDLTSKLSMVNDVNSEDKLLDFSEASSCIALAAGNYINSSTSVKDKNFQLAKYCLSLIQDANDDITHELDIIKSCEFLEKYQCSLVPIEVRSVDDKFQLLKNCLNKNKNLYRNLEEIVEAGTFLCKDKTVNKKYLEGEALRLVAEKAMNNNDLEILEIVMASLVHRNHKPCWTECIKCMKYLDFPITRKYEVGKYAIAHCPKSALHETFKLIKEIELALFNVPENVQKSECPPLIDSNTNSNLIKQPMKFISTGLTDISTKLSLKSLIDKSSDTLIKLSNQVIQLGVQGGNEFYKNSRTKNLDKMALNLIYETGGTFELEDKLDPEYTALIKVFRLTYLLPTIQPQSNIDQIHLKLLKCNFHRDTYLSIVHSVFIDDINLIHDLRHDLTPNLFNRSLILSMIRFNLIFKYAFQLPMKTISESDFESILKPLMPKMSKQELSVLNSMEQEFKDYYLLDKITVILPDICALKFFSSVDYRMNIILKLCEFRDTVDPFRYSLLLCDRYGIDRQVVTLKYFISFCTKNVTTDKIAFEENYGRFQSIFDLTYFTDNQIASRKDLESFLISNSVGRIAEFRIVLDVIERVNCDFVLFERSVKEHKRCLNLYDSIYGDRKNCTYLDFFNGSHKKIIDALKHVINVDNLELCSQLMHEFQLGEQFAKIKEEFSVVLANQILWSSEKQSKNQENRFSDRFEKSLKNFSLCDYNNCKDFICSTLFEKSNSHINLETKITILKIALSYIDEICESTHPDDVIKNWSQVNMEVTIWLDHIDNSVTKVVNQLRSLANVSEDIIKIAEYLPPENYWDCLMKEMLLSGISYQDFFTFTWDLNIESFIVEEAVGDHISHIVLSKYVSTEKIVENLSQIFNELDEFLDSEPIGSIISTILSYLTNETQFEIVHWLLNEFVYRIRQTKAPCTVDLTKHIFSIMSQWKLPINKKWEITNTNNLFIIDALIQDCDSPDRMTLVGRVIELIELIHEDNNLWQCWVKSCIIKGAGYSCLVFERFIHLKANRLYKNRIQKLIKDAIQSLIVFNPSDAVSLLILKDPIESQEQIQSILIDLKSDPVEYSNTMKSISGKALQIIVDQKLIPLYAKTGLFQRLVNFMTKEKDDPDMVQDVLEQLKKNGLHDEATWLASSSSHINPAMKTIEMVSGFWKRFSTGGGS